MRITVIGGSGLVGAKLVDTLRHRGHDVVAASRRSGVDTLTGEGLAAAIAGARVVIDVTNSPSFANSCASSITASASLRNFCRACSSCSFRPIKLGRVPAKEWASA